MHLQNDKTEAQIRAKLVELAVGLEKRFSKQNKTTTKKPYTVEPVLTATSIHRSPPDKRPEKKVPAELMVKLL